MRFFRIFQLFFGVARSSIAENVVYFLLSFINPMTSLLYWHGAYNTSSLASLGWSFSEIATYYLLVVTGGAMLMAHIENDIAYEDIYQGNLSQHLTRPFPYFIDKLFLELPWRLIQGSFGILFIIIYALIFHGSLHVVTDPVRFVGAITICVLAFFLSFFLKMMVGLTALWTTDFSGMKELFDVIALVLAGFVFPLSLFPAQVAKVILFQPFAYIVYMPILAMIGKVPVTQLPQVIGMQLFWIGIFFSGLCFLWSHGVKKFTGVGN